MSVLRLKLVRSIPYNQHPVYRAVIANASAQGLGLRTDLTKKLCALDDQREPGVGRRKFLRQLLGASAAGLTLTSTASLTGCETVEEIGRLLLASVLKVISEKASYSLDAVRQGTDSIVGLVDLYNERAKTAVGDLEARLQALQETVDGGFASFSVPAGSVNTYNIRGLSTDQAAKHSIFAASALNSLTSGEFSVE